MEEILTGGNVGGAVRIGATVRRATGPWTPAVHALLDHLQGRLPHVPRVHGFDDQGREVLDYLPGQVVDLGAQRLSPAQLTALTRWTRQLHEATADFAHPGPWRLPPVPGSALIGHNDIAAYNACFDGDDLVGVFDWDLAGPTTARLEFGFLAWNGVPLWDPAVDPALAAERLRIIAAGCSGHDPHAILDAVPHRIQIMIDSIPAAAAAGDPGMVNLLAAGEPAQTRISLAALVERIPAIHAALG